MLSIGTVHANSSGEVAERAKQIIKLCSNIVIRQSLDYLVNRATSRAEAAAAPALEEMKALRPTDGFR